jgi:hypothetical protein
MLDSNRKQWHVRCVCYVSADSEWGQTPTFEALSEGAPHTHETLVLLNSQGRVQRATELPAPASS